MIQLIDKKANFFHIAYKNFCKKIIFLLFIPQFADQTTDQKPA